MIIGGSGPELIFGGDGRDTIFAGSGADTIYAGFGPTLVHGGSGLDWIVGGGAKVVYDVLLFRSFRKLKPPEEKNSHLAGSNRHVAL